MTGPVEEWHGYSHYSPGLGEVALHIGRVPGRKSVAVYTVDYPVTGGAVSAVRAYCRSEEDGRALLAALRRIATGPR